jgi:nucleoside-diphosphate-sugar epimerase
MVIFVTGGTGYVGAAVADRLVAAGHSVVGLARSDQAETALRRRGVEPYRGDLCDRARLAETARQADATIHVASAGRGPEAAEAEASAVEAFLDGLDGSGKTLLYTSGGVVYGDTGTGVADEEAPLNPPPERAWRLPLEQRVLDAGDRGIRPVVIRPCFVYGRAGGVAARLIDGARHGGVARYIDAGENRFSTVHVDDLADLYLLVLENQRASGPYNASSAEVAQHELAEAVARLVGGDAASWPLAEARSRLGIFADTMAMNGRISAGRARSELGWVPTRPALLDEIEHGSYRAVDEALGAGAAAGAR